MSENLLCFLYMYLGLGLVFWVGVIYVWRQGDIGLQDRRRRLNLLTLVGGFALYMAIHGFFQFIAPGL